MNHQPSGKRRLKARFIDWAGFFIATSSLVLAKTVLQCCNSLDSDPPILKGQFTTFDIVVANNSNDPVFLIDILIIVWIAMGLASSFLYEVPLVALCGQTVGKIMTGVKVVRVDGNGVPGWWRSAVRWAALYAPAMIPVAGWLVLLLVFTLALRDPRGRGLHDKIAGTIVVDTRPAAGDKNDDRT